MKISYDETKRRKTFNERGLDFEDAAHVFEGETFEMEDTRINYGEKRILCFGILNKRAVVVGYVQRGDTRHIFSMRHCHEKETKKIQKKLQKQLH